MSENYKCKICGASLELSEIETVHSIYPIDEETGYIEWHMNIMEEQTGAEATEVRITCSENPDHETGYKVDNNNDKIIPIKEVK